MRLRLAGVAVAIMATLATAISTSWEYLQSSDEIMPLAENAVEIVPFVNSAVRMSGLMFYGHRAVVFVFSVLFIAAIGYCLASGADVRANPVTVLGAFFLAGIAGYLVGWMGLGIAPIFGGGISPLERLSPLGWTLAVIAPTVAEGIQYGLVGFAGVAIAEFNVFNRLRRRPATTVQTTDTNAAQ